MYFIGLRGAAAVPWPITRDSVQSITVTNPQNYLGFIMPVAQFHTMSAAVAPTAWDARQPGYAAHRAHCRDRRSRLVARCLHRRSTLCVHRCGRLRYSERDHSRQLDAQCRASSAPLRDFLDALTALAANCGFDQCHKYITM
jgi:hypothetical protein